MSTLQPRVRRGRRSALRKRDNGLVKTLNFHDSDGEFSPNDGGSSPFHSPSMESYDEPDYLEVDISTPYLNSTSRSARTFISSRKLSPIPFGIDDENDGDVEDDEQRVPAPGKHVISPDEACPISPPSRKLRALRLFDTPHTPKSLLQKARRRRLTDERKSNSKENGEKVEANVNPFTPCNNRPLSCSVSSGMASIKRSREQMEKSLLEDSADEIEIDMPSTKKIALHEINTSRYNEEFHEVCKLGDGEFGSVYKCIHRLDGCTYAIKKSKAPVAGSQYERNAMNEVYAHAVLGKHQHVVRYYSAWAEDDYMYIQNEYCNGGSLADVIDTNRKTGRKLGEDEFKQILLQVSRGLRYIHSQNLVHLDVKPGNVFIHRNPKFLNSPESGMESLEEDDEVEEAITYKIGDLGHVTSVSNPTVDDGDCRYLPKEILNDDYENLTKSDIFSLGLTMYEAAGGYPLPKNGPKWHAIRRGELPSLPHLTVEMNHLIKSMVDPDPTQRPSATQISQHPVLCPQAKKSKAQLRKELNEERFKNQMLSRKLIEATQCLVQNTPVFAQPDKVSRLIGNRMKRSLSMTNF
ncbi:wee1-like protein kinase [Mytilus trossulus]|uniref:wee1-like protein kinase n=1 Tax=Mytilus trossulus TaxID=6551 RepID=UPI003007E12E